MIVVGHGADDVREAVASWGITPDAGLRRAGRAARHRPRGRRSPSAPSAGPPRCSSRTATSIRSPASDLRAPRCASHRRTDSAATIASDGARRARRLRPGRSARARGSSRSSRTSTRRPQVRRRSARSSIELVRLPPAPTSSGAAAARPQEPPARVLPEPGLPILLDEGERVSAVRGRHRRRDGRQLPRRARGARGASCASASTRRTWPPGSRSSTPATTYIDVDVEIGADTVIHPITFLERGSRDRRRCEIGPSTRDRGLARRRRARVVRFSVARGRADRPRMPRSGPFARLRPGRSWTTARRSAPSSRSRTPASARASKVPHLTYVGDADDRRRREHRGRHRDRELRRLRQAPDRDRRRGADRFGYDAGGAGEVRQGRGHGGRIGDHEGRARRARSPSSGPSSGSSRGTASARTPSTAVAGETAKGATRGDHHEEADDAVHRHHPPGARARDRRQPRHPGVPSRSSRRFAVGRDLLPLRGERARRRRVRRADPLRARQRGDHGAAHHDRRHEARLGQAHHGRDPVLRLLAPGPQGPLARADQREARRRPARRPPAPTASSRSTCTRARSRATSTSRSTTSRRCRSCRTTSRTSWGCTATTSSSWRPTPAASRPRRSSASTCTPTWRSCTSAAAAPRRTRSRRWRSSVRSTAGRASSSTT